MKKELLEKIQSGGLHQTLLKEKLLAIFEKANEPLSVPELLKKLKRYHLTPHKTTLYRELTGLTEANILEEAKLNDGIKSYELCHEDHHHHFICQNCNGVVDFENDALEKTITNAMKNLRRKGHVTAEHRLNFYGLCAACK